MLNPKLSLAAFTAVLGLAVLALPRTELDPQEVARRRLLKQHLAAIDEQVRLNHMLIASGTWDPNTFFNIMQVVRNRNAVMKELYGETPQLLREYEAVYLEVSQLQRMMLDRLESGQVRRSECWCCYVLSPFTIELRELKAKLGVGQGFEESISRETIERYNRLKYPVTTMTATVAVPTVPMTSNRTIASPNSNVETPKLSLPNLNVLPEK
ncbi:hypothetical protein [Limnoglobus roseus]|uniref:Uncharacterized protein n=1 Tax=Limnoglobus roseus TaxID=2598579 RepID=A0A5C1A3K0_9BACT|nr:hypothetical protein [Limnoglobus roseus]QEL13659.1 hypothetical protein PX52LOC_00517 [Limnoglobus roseus]